MTHWLHGVYFHAWHFVYQQVQLTNWAGNVVAGIFTFLVVGLFWPPTRKSFTRFVGRFFSAVHNKLDAQHQERMTQAQTHHNEAIALAKAHHAEHMAALAKPKPAPKQSPTPAKATATVKKAPPRPARSTK